MADDTITLTIVAKDLASGNIQKAVTGLDQLSRQSGLTGWAVKGMALSMGAMLNPAALVAKGIGAVADALGDATTAFREDQVSQAQLRSALEANIESWDGNTDAIEKVIASRVRLGFSDDEQRASLALIVAQVGDVNDALEVQRTAMDLTRLKGNSLAESSTLLAKAYNGSLTGLQKMGISLKKGTDGLEAISAVQQRAAGQAEAYGKTSAGAAAAFDAKVGELQESLGALVDGPARGFITFLDNVVSRIAGQGGTTLSENMQLLIDDVKGLDDATSHAAATGVKLFALSLEDAQKKLDNLVVAGRANMSNAGEMVATLGPQFLILAENVGVTGESLFALASAYEKAGKSQEEFRSAAIAATNGTRSTVTSMVSAWTLGMNRVSEVTETAMEQTAANVRGIAWNIPMGVVDAVKSGIPDVRSVMRDLRWAIEHPMALTKDRAKILGALTGQRMVDGINSKNPLIRQAAIDARAALLTQWNSLPAKAMELGRLTIKELVRGLSTGESYALGLYGETGTSHGQRQLRRNRRDGDRAAGGPVMAGRTYLVGERGPELLHMGGGSGRISPNAGFGGTFVYAPQYSTASPAEAALFAANMGPHVARWMRDNRR